MNLPTSLIRPRFGPWVDLPRDQWAAGQAAEYDQSWAEFRQAVETFTGTLPDVVEAINKQVP